MIIQVGALPVGLTPTFSRPASRSLLATDPHLPASARAHRPGSSGWLIAAGCQFLRQTPRSASPSYATSLARVMFFARTSAVLRATARQLAAELCKIDVLRPIDVQIIQELCQLRFGRHLHHVHPTSISATVAHECYSCMAGAGGHHISDRAESDPERFQAQRAGIFNVSQAEGLAQQVGAVEA